MPKIKQSIETVVIENGVVTEERRNQTLSWGTEPPFVKLYLQDVLYLSDMPKHHEKILYELLKRSSYASEGMTVSLSAGTKRIIAKELNIQNVRSINNVLSDLVKGKILFRIETGVYQFNTMFFGKGDWQDIARMRLEINYDEIQGRTFSSYLIKKEAVEEQQNLDEEAKAFFEHKPPITQPKGKKQASA